MEDSENAMLDADGSSVEEQNEGMGIDPIAAEASEDAETAQPSGNDDPYGVKKRLGMQAKRHQKEMRRLQEQLSQMQAQMGNRLPEFSSAPSDPFVSPGQPSPPSGSEEERIQKAVRYALQARDNEAQAAKAAEAQAHVQKQYQRLHDEFDRAGDRYEDFDEVVRGDDVPFSPAIRDALLLVDNPADVAYRLGKDRDKLSKIAQLHPLDQAREVSKLSFALMNGTADKKPQQGSGSNPVNQMRPNPATSGAITNRTPAATIRARMKAGTWK